MSLRDKYVLDLKALEIRLKYVENMIRLLGVHDTPVEHLEKWFDEQDAVVKAIIKQENKIKRLYKK
jgi:hypothetical protein